MNQSEPSFPFLAVARPEMIMALTGRATFEIFKLVR